MDMMWRGCVVIVVVVSWWVGGSSGWRLGIVAAVELFGSSCRCCRVVAVVVVHLRRYARCGRFVSLLERRDSGAIDFHTKALPSTWRRQPASFPHPTPTHPCM